MLFIQKMHNFSQVSNFRFNMQKLKTNFVLNLQKIGCQGGNSLEKQNINTKLCNWIGISIDMKTLQLIPNINTKKEVILCTLNVNMQTNQSMMWLKKKAKVFIDEQCFILLQPAYQSVRVLVHDAQQAVPIWGRKLHRMLH
jgi:hypothetical protein